MSEKELSGLTLLIPDKPDVERDSVASAWASKGGTVRRLAKFWEPPDVPPSSVRVYGPDTFGLVLAEIYGLSLLEPSQEVALQMPADLARRKMVAATLEAAFDWSFPTFIKPFVPKAFTARVYESRDELAIETRGMDLTAGVLGSEIVRIEAEARAFILDGYVLDCALYEGEASTAGALLCANRLAQLGLFPPAVVVDLACLEGGTWVFLEANAAWGAGLNGCDAAKVLPAIERATRPKHSEVTV